MKVGRLVWKMIRLCQYLFRVESDAVKAGASHEAHKALQTRCPGQHLPGWDFDLVFGIFNFFSEVTNIFLVGEGCKLKRSSTEDDSLA